MSWLLLTYNTGLVYSQRMNKFIPIGNCVVCGLEGHIAGRHCPLYKTRARRKGGNISNTTRANRFIIWLLEHIELSTLQQTGVLDVAGGQGRLSTIFQVDYQVPTTMIDPRSLTFTDGQIKRFNLQLNDPDRHDSPPSWPRQLNILFKDDFLEDDLHKRIFDSCSLILGMHPDEATERIVQFGLKYRKSFAVLPCCVFPKSFPDRRLNNGTKVVVYNDLVQYLLELDPGIKTAKLNIPGRNTIVFKFFDE
eukprot:TRINITY_DN5340_c0_g1_i2.p1 TRINITY_DN5340_c0_g1~~TRINITY_DN5340_c0_g1_i2.p1  ORF type:complete len:250 (-),score=20.37 TRINITY_DN5340_c0_g1_i2:37-786(-)